MSQNTLHKAGSPLSAEELEREKTRKSYRKERRKKRDKLGEIKELNITAMMDMMTIILVFLLKSYISSSSSITLKEENLAIPRSTIKTQPQDNINITISLVDVTVNDKEVCKVINGNIPNEYREGGKDSMLISPILRVLKKEVEKQKYIAKYNPKAEFDGKMNLIADKRVPYRTILEVLYTAGQVELGQYKLMVLKNE